MDEASGLERLRWFTYGKGRLVAGGACESLLQEAQIRLNRLLTDEEIRESLFEILELTQESLIQPTAAIKGYRPGISRWSKILLHDGTSLPIKDIRLGHQVTSVHTATGQISANEVVEINEYYSSKWRHYFDHDDVDPELRASPHQMIVVPDRNAQQSLFVTLEPLEKALLMDSVYKFVADTSAFIASPPTLSAKRLGFQYNQSRFYNRQDLLSLTLAKFPHTYIANGHVLPDDKLCRQALRY